MGYEPYDCSFGDVSLSFPGSLTDVIVDKTFIIPERDVDLVEIPGKDGAIAFDNGRYKNFQLSIEKIFRPQPPYDVQADAKAFFGAAGAVAALHGYQKLTLPYRDDAYRLAVYKGTSGGQFAPWFSSARITFNFECKPFWYLNVGDEWQEFEPRSSSADMPRISFLGGRPFTSKPLIRFYGNGTLRIGDSFFHEDSMKLLVSVNGLNTDTYPYVDVDCEAMTISYNGTNLSEYVSVYNVDGSRGFPDLADFKQQHLGVEVSQDCIAEIKTREASL